MGSHPKSLAALVIVLVVVVGLLSVYASMCCNIWGIRHRIVKLLRWCFCLSKPSEPDSNATPSANISPWRRRNEVAIAQPSSDIEASSNEPFSGTYRNRTPPPNYSLLKSPSPPTYSTAINRVIQKDPIVNGACPNWVATVNEREQTVKASSDGGVLNLSYVNSDTDEHNDTFEHNNPAEHSNSFNKDDNLRESKRHLEDGDKNDVGCSPFGKRRRERKKSIPVAHQGSDLLNESVCDSFKIISTWSTPFSQCKPFQDPENVYALNSICHFVNTKYIVQGQKRDSVTRSFIVSPVKLDMIDEARLESYKNRNNEDSNGGDSSYESSEDPLPSYSPENEDFRTMLSNMPELTVTDPDDNVIYQNGRTVTPRCSVTQIGFPEGLQQEDSPQISSQNSSQTCSEGDLPQEGTLNNFIYDVPVLTVTDPENKQIYQSGFTITVN